MKYIFSCIDKAIEIIEDILCAVPMAFIIIIEIAQVFFRYVLSSGVVWSDEVITNLLIIVVMFGGAKAIRKNEHTELTGTVDAMPKIPRYFFRVLTTVITLIFLVALFVSSIQFVTTTGNLKTTNLRIPRAYCYFPLAAGSGFMVYEFIKKIKWRIIRETIDIYDPELYTEGEK